MSTMLMCCETQTRAPTCTHRCKQHSCHNQDHRCCQAGTWDTITRQTAPVEWHLIVSGMLPGEGIAGPLAGLWLMELREIPTRQCQAGRWPHGLARGSQHWGHCLRQSLETDW